jgi:hypothetical protein
MDAAHATVRNYPGGAESLGPRVGISPAVLRNKVNPNSNTHRLAIDEASAIMGVSGDHLMLHALAAEHGFVLRKAAAADAGKSVLDLILGAQAREGAFAQAVQDALSDGVITDNEMRQIEAAGFCVQEAVMVLLGRLRAQAATRPAA